MNNKQELQENAFHGESCLHFQFLKLLLLQKLSRKIFTETTFLEYVSLQHL